MSERLTSKWTERAADAFGKSGAKGDRGEDFLAEVFQSWGWEYEQHPSSFSHQIGGVDISFKAPNWANWYTADVKANLDQYGSFYVETDKNGWLFNPKKVSHRIWHVNSDNGWMCWYDRKEMRQHIIRNGLSDSGLLKVTVKDNLPFLTRRKYNIPTPQTDADFSDVPF